jgi:hypothetical protein
MKNIKTYLVIAICILMNASCTAPDNEEIQVEKTAMATITNTGGSPEVFVTSNCVTTRYATPCLNIEVKKGDVITALGFSYSTDNSNNYGGTNVNVTANITIQIDNKTVKTGVGHCSYQYN